MKIDVLLVVDNSCRELVSALLIQHYLEFFKISSQICSKLIWRLAFNRSRPKAVVLPNAGSPSCKSISDRSFVFVLPCESGNGQRDQVLNCHVGTHLYKCDTEYVDLFFSWGKLMTQWLVESGAYSSAQIVTSGHPATDHWLIQNERKCRHRVGLTTTFRVLSNSVGGSQNFIKWIYETEYGGGSDGSYFSPPEHAEAWIYWEAAFIRSIANIVHEVLIPNSINCQIRPHPFEVKKPYKFLTEKSGGLVQIEKKGSITDWFDNIDILFTYLSGSAIDAFVKGLPVVSLQKILNPDALNRIPKGFIYDYYEYCWQLESLEQIKDYSHDAFEGKLEPARNMGAFHEYVYNHFKFPRKRPSAFLVAEAIAEFLNNNKPRTFRLVESKKSSFIKKWAKYAMKLYPETMIDYMFLKKILNIDEYSPLFTYISWKIVENMEAKVTAKAIIETCEKMTGVRYEQ